jgi:DNA-cytosine methyltransferase
MKEIIVLSLFDGMSCGRLAIERAGYVLKKYYASEIDPYALEVANDNFPQNINLGDVLNWRDWDIDWASIDLLVGGSPCQGFARDGKKLAFDDDRSILFFVYVNILAHIRKVNPNVKFFLENVKMKKEFTETISEYIGLEPSYLNSNLLTAQNRQRHYWMNWDFEMPEDLGITLPDILEIGAAARHPELLIEEKRWAGTNIEKFMGQGLTQVAFTERRTEEAKQIRKEYKAKYGRDFSPRRAKEMVPRTDGKMNCLTACYTIKEHSVLDELSIYRKMTAIECERLQSVPDQYTKAVSDNQRKKMLGNGWTIDVVAHMLRSAWD